MVSREERSSGQAWSERPPDFVKHSQKANGAEPSKRVGKPGIDARVEDPLPTQQVRLFREFGPVQSEPCIPYPNR